MPDPINSHIVRHKANPNPDYAQGVVDEIVCRDGFRMSVQASAGHYCTPRADVGPYTAFEVASPRYADNRPYRNNSWGRQAAPECWGWVPLDKLLKLIVKHGGVAD